MSVALERSNRIGGTGFIRGISCIPIYESPDIAGILPEDRRFQAGEQPVPWPGKAGVEREESTSCSSSIGRNSDCSRGSSGSDGGDSGEAEVQSTFKGPLDTMDALEESLPIRRGISKFYRGKSKSFTSMADVSPFIKDLAKPGNSHPRKRKNLLAFSSNCDKHQNNHPTRNTGGSLSKRPANSSRLNLTAATSSSDSNSHSAEDHEPSRLLPPLHPHGKVSSPLGTSLPQKCSFSMRSFSLTDLPGATSSTSPRDNKHKRFH